jgi:hypothetical protein
MSVLAPPRPTKKAPPVELCKPLKGDDDGKCHLLVTMTRAYCGKTWPRGTWTRANTHSDGRLGTCGRPPCQACLRGEAAGL